MARFIVNHPWDPKYAVPAYTHLEPPGNRGVLHTYPLPRETISSGIPFDTAYALPEYVVHEPQGRGVHFTWQARRKTIPVRQPHYLGDSDPGKVAPSGDAIRRFGEQAAAVILASIQEAAPAEREKALNTALAMLDPDLPNRFYMRVDQYVARGMGDEAAVKSALVSAIAEGYTKGVLDLAKSGQPALGGFLGKVGKALSRPVVKTAKAAATVGKTIGKGAATVGKGAASVAVKAAKGVAKLGCKVAGSSLGQAAAAGAGGPAGAVGGAAAAGLCAKPAAVGPVDSIVGTAKDVMGAIPWKPVLIGGAALGGIVLLTKMRKK